MRARRCTIDSSCVIVLDHLDLMPQLSLLFSIVLVPKAVRDDAFLQRCDGYEKGTVDFLSSGGGVGSRRS
jgi:hypothetical protein